METDKPSFSWLVLKKAWKGTLATFDATPLSISLAVILIAASLATQYFRHGFAEMSADLLKTFWDTVWPVLAVGSAVALWNLWLAPFALAYEAAKSNASEEATEATPSLKYGESTRPDWTPWKHMTSFGVTQFAKIIAKEDPHIATISTTAAGYRQLIFAAVKDGSLPYIKRYFDHNGRQIEYSLDEGKTHIARAEALKWAKAKSFSMNHIE